MTESMSDKIKDKIKEIQSYIKKYNNREGEKAIIGFGSDLDLETKYVYPPISSLQFLLGRDGKPGGFPRGKFTVISGPERSGKSTLLLQTIAHDMSMDKEAIWAWVDAENALDQTFATALGIDMSRLVIIKVGTLEEQLQRIIDLGKLSLLKGIVVDSVGGLVPQAEIKDSKGKEHELEHQGMLDLQRKLGQFFRMSNGAINNGNTAVILIAHVYQDINSYGAPLVVKGGNALKHWSHVRLMLSRLKDKDAATKTVMADGSIEKVDSGHEVKIKLDKTRQNANENHFIVVPFTYGIGFNVVESNINLAINFSVIKRTGPTYTFEDQKFKGREAVSEYFKSNPKSYQILIKQLEQLKPDSVVITEESIELEQ